MPRWRGRRGDHACAMAIAVATAIASVGAAAAGGDSDAEFDYRRLSGIITPGFASTQLRAWSVLDCPYSPFDFNPLDSVWIDTAKLFSAVNCWLKCMLLDLYNQTDHPECKSRTDSGLSTITELDPGYIAGATRVTQFSILSPWERPPIKDVFCIYGIDSKTEIR